MEGISDILIAAASLGRESNLGPDRTPGRQPNHIFFLDTANHS